MYKKRHNEFTALLRVVVGGVGAAPWLGKLFCIDKQLLVGVVDGNHLGEHTSVYGNDRFLLKA